MHMTKTNAMRMLDSVGIRYRTIAYEYQEHDPDGVHLAKATGLQPEQIFKTLVTQGDKTGVHVFCIPVSNELDLKKAASASGDKKIEMLHVRDLLNTTGYIRGGCSPIGMKKSYPTHIDETAILFDEISISAGVKGNLIIIEPNALQAFISAVFFDVIK
jgi:Cys-tRNA(Pro)/Cys-tRNA(Cys) deacylase